MRIYRKVFSKDSDLRDLQQYIRRPSKSSRKLQAEGGSLLMEAKNKAYDSAIDADRQGLSDEEIALVAENVGKNKGGKYFGLATAAALGLPAGIGVGLSTNSVGKGIAAGLGAAALGGGLGYLNGKDIAGTEAREEVENALVERRRMMNLLRSKNFSSDDKKDGKAKLSSFKSKRGIGRAAILGLGLSGPAGRLMGIRAAENADIANPNLTDEELVNIAKKKGALSGGIVGAIEGGSLSKSLGGALVGAGFGALGGYFGSKKAVREKTIKRALASHR